MLSSFPHFHAPKSVARCGCVIPSKLYVAVYAPAKYHITTVIVCICKVFESAQRIAPLILGLDTRHVGGTLGQNHDQQRPVAPDLKNDRPFTGEDRFGVLMKRVKYIIVHC